MTAENGARSTSEERRTRKQAHSGRTLKARFGPSTSGPVCARLHQPAAAWCKRAHYALWAMAPTTWIRLARAKCPDVWRRSTPSAPPTPTATIHQTESGWWRLTPQSTRIPFGHCIFANLPPPCWPEGLRVGRYPFTPSAFRAFGSRARLPLSREVSYSNPVGRAFPHDHEISDDLGRRLRSTDGPLRRRSSCHHAIAGCKLNPGCAPACPCAPWRIISQ